MPLPARYTPDGAAIPGGMGAVQICFDAILERRVAIKFLQAGTHRRRMNDELAALLQMRSKHVVQVYDVLALDGGSVGIVQEFIDGPDLIESLAPPASLDAYYRQLWQIAAGIADIHSLDVIHRDIKPNNMKTDPEGVIKIFDFGLARNEGPAASTLGFVGTPGFAAPELCVGIARFTAAADTYAFGATALYLGLQGLPVDLWAVPPGIAPVDSFSRMRFPAHPAAVPMADDVADVLLRCLAPVAADRPTMSEVRDTLARHILNGRHQAILVYNNRPSRLDNDNRVVVLNFAGVGKADVVYDGLKFFLENVEGEVVVNNIDVGDGYVIPGSCVVALGRYPRKAIERRFITFDVSHPEIVL
jgi:serine/threonine-protein kinase